MRQKFKLQFFTFYRKKISHITEILVPIIKTEDELPVNNSNQILQQNGESAFTHEEDLHGHSGISTKKK